MKVTRRKEEFLRKDQRPILQKFNKFSFYSGDTPVTRSNFVPHLFPIPLLSVSRLEPLLFVSTHILVCVGPKAHLLAHMKAQKPIFSD